MSRATYASPCCAQDYVALTGIGLEDSGVAWVARLPVERGRNIFSAGLIE